MSRLPSGGAGPMAPVALPDGAPERFRWRGRPYLVREVLASWVRVEPWWASPQVRALLTGADVAGADVAGAALSPLGLQEVEQEHWRVLATAGRSGAPGVFELSRSSADGSWRLTRVLD